MVEGLVTSKQRKLLEEADKNGGIDKEKGEDIYHEKTFYRVVKKLESLDILERKEAPEKTDFLYIWKLTEFGREVLDRENN